MLRIKDHAKDIKMYRQLKQEREKEIRTIEKEQEESLYYQEEDEYVHQMEERGPSPKQEFQREISFGQDPSKSTVLRNQAIYNALNPGEGPP